VLPDSISDIALLIYLRHHRGQQLPIDTLFGFKTMYNCKDALILEFASSLAVHHYWSLCTQMIPIGPHKALVYTATAAEVWTQKMDFTMENDVLETAAKLRWKASKHGGRAYAGPTATPKALAASRRRGNGTISPFHFSADVEIMGELGKEDREVLALLMQHATRSTGINLCETDYRRAPLAGEFVHLAAQDSSERPGKLRVFLSSADEVRKLHNALHG